MPSVTDEWRDARALSGRPRAPGLPPTGPVAPAPANVPQLSRHDGKLLSARELLTAHMEQPQCYQCHRKIDPIGFGLEHFNAVGQWREMETTEIAVNNRVRKSKEHPIDTTGQLPDGTEFNGFDELRDAIAERDALVDDIKLVSILAVGLILLSIVVFFRSPFVLLHIGLSMGTTATVARRIGEGKPEDAGLESAQGREDRQDDLYSTTCGSR